MTTRIRSGSEVHFREATKALERGFSGLKKPEIFTSQEETNSLSRLIRRKKSSRTKFYQSLCKKGRKEGDIENRS